MFNCSSAEKNEKINAKNLLNQGPVSHLKNLHHSCNHNVQILVKTRSSHLQVYLLVINAVLIVDVQQFVFDPADLLGRLFPSLVVQAVFLIKLSQTHHGLLPHSPLARSESTDTDSIQKSYCSFLSRMKDVVVISAALDRVFVSPFCPRSYLVRIPTADHQPGWGLFSQHLWWWQWHHDGWLPLGHGTELSDTLIGQFKDTG